MHRLQFDSVRTARGIKLNMRSSEKANGVASSGSGSGSVSVSKGRVVEFGHKKPGAATVLLRC
jgi:hypothetical protein